MNETKLSLIFLKRDGLKTILSALGVIIAAFLIVGVGIISSSAVDSLFKSFEVFGSDRIIVLPFKLSGTTSASGLTSFDDKDLKTFLSHPCVVNGYGATGTRQIPIVWKNKEAFILLIGSEQYLKDFKLYFKLKKGRYLKKGGRRGAVLGYYIWKEVFPNIKVGDKLTIGNKTFRVVGLLDKQEFSSGGINSETTIFVSTRDLQDLLNTKDYRFIILKSVCPLNQTIKDLEKMTKKDVTFITSDFMKQQLSSSINAFMFGTFALSIIANVVAILGVTNSLLASVIRRKKQIAIMKALGMNNKQLFLSLFFQAAILVGGALILGALLGVGTSFIATHYLKWDRKIPYWIGLAMLGIFLISTLVPTLVALREVNKISPIEAMK